MAKKNDSYTHALNQIRLDKAERHPNDSIGFGISDEGRKALAQYRRQKSGGGNASVVIFVLIAVIGFVLVFIGLNGGF